jgi:transposase
LVDLETNHIVDLLADREVATLANWLCGHPGVEIIARDRAGAYARGGREGAPAACQVADRWHLLRNCSDAVLDIVERRYRLVRGVANSLVSELKAGNSPKPVPTGGHQEQRKAKCDEVLRLGALGWSQLAIKRHLNVDLKTIRKWLKDQRPGTWQRRVHSANPADVHEIYLRKRWREGCRNATQLYREVCERGYDRNVKTLGEWVKARLRDEAPAPQSRLPDGAPAFRAGARRPSHGWLDSMAQHRRRGHSNLP